MRTAAILFDDLSHRCQVASLRFLAWFDDGFEALTRTAFTGLILADCEAKKVKTDISVMLMQRMYNAGFGLL